MMFSGLALIAACSFSTCGLRRGENAVETAQDRERKDDFAIFVPLVWARSRLQMLQMKFASWGWVSADTFFCSSVCGTSHYPSLKQVSSRLANEPLPLLDVFIDSCMSVRFTQMAVRADQRLEDVLVAGELVAPVASHGRSSSSRS